MVGGTKHQKLWLYQGLQTVFFTVLVLMIWGCSSKDSKPESKPVADLILTNGKVYSYTWDDPGPDGSPAADAPLQDGQWQPDAAAVAVKDGRILFVGSNEAVAVYQGQGTRVIDVNGATVLPGFVDSHAHVEGIGANLERVDLTAAQTEAEAVDLMLAQAQTVPEGSWVIGRGWDEGAWADRYPDKTLVTEKLPHHPAVMNGLHGFAAWGNQMALDRAGITAETKSPVGGEIVVDEKGNPTGLLMNNAADLLNDAVPAPDQTQIEARMLAGLEEMARSGYVAVHLAGVKSPSMAALKSLARQNRLKLRVYAMISAADRPLMEEYLEAGPFRSEDGMLMVRSVKAYYDGALGSRGARLLQDYSDKPGYRGVSGADYGFDQELVARLVVAGFQTAIHAIGDAGNRETLDFFETVSKQFPESLNLRHRIEHAQVVHPDDFQRFAQLKVIASMEPPHAVEDKTWAEDRLGPERIKGAYAWRTFRQKGVGIVFNSDLTGSDHNIFYGLHAAITRRDKQLLPPQGWYPEQALTAEEAIRAYTIWGARASFLEEETGTLAVGKEADLTVISIDPHNLDLANAGSLLQGQVVYTVVGGTLIYENPRP